MKLMSINEAARRGIERVRKPIWANSFDHLKIDIFDGKPGPWLHIYGPFNQECNGRDPVNLLIVSEFVGDLDEPCLVPYEGPLPDSDEYKAEVKKFEGCLKE